LHDVRYEELFHERVCVAVALQHPFARRRAIPITELAAEPLIGLTREDYPNYYDYLSMIFSKVKQKPRVVEEHDSSSGVISAVEAGTGVAIGADTLGHSFGNRVKVLHITPEPKPISVGIVGTKGRLSPAAEKFWQCAKEAASPAPRPKASGAPQYEFGSVQEKLSRLFVRPSVITAQDRRLDRVPMSLFVVTLVSIICYTAREYPPKWS
jgi:DNA-binding transcriptional LysR family regulator